MGSQLDQVLVLWCCHSSNHECCLRVCGSDFFFCVCPGNLSKVLYSIIFNRNLRIMHRRILRSSGNNPWEWMTMRWGEEVLEAEERADWDLKMKSWGCGWNLTNLRSDTKYLSLQLVASVWLREMCSSWRKYVAWELAPRAERILLP